MNLPVQLQDNETVVRIIRRHPLSLIGRLVGVGVLLVLVIAAWVWLRSLAGASDGVRTGLDITMAIVAFIALVYAGMYWYRYQHDLWIVTNDRLIDSTKTTPFSQEVKTATLTNIQDINIRKHGIFQTIFEYGDVVCQTASAAGRTFEFLGVARPADILDLIDDQRTLAQRRMNSGQP